MSRRLILNLLGLGIILGLAGCASGPTPLSSDKSTFGSFLSTAPDPDGDGDTTGYDHFAKHRQSIGRKVFIFDPGYHAWAVYDAEGNLVNTGKASGGSLFCPDIGRRCTTITGEYRIISKGDFDCKSTKYPIETNGGAPMPYCMYFHPNGYGIHGSYDIPDYNASHGCIRVTPTAARWLNENFLDIGSKVIVWHYE